MSADLRGAGGLTPSRVQPLLMLHDQVGRIRAYKLVDAEGYSPISTACLDRDCAAGVNVATLNWCMSWWRPGHRILVVEFTRADIAAIPAASDGKFRLHRCKVEKNLADLGLITNNTENAA